MLITINIRNKCFVRQEAFSVIFSTDCIVVLFDLICKSYLIWLNCNKKVLILVIFFVSFFYGAALSSYQNIVRRFVLFTVPPLLLPFQTRYPTYCPAEYFPGLIRKLEIRVSSISQILSQESEAYFQPSQTL